MTVRSYPALEAFINKAHTCVMDTPAILAFLDAGIPVSHLIYDAVTANDHPELFESDRSRCIYGGNLAGPWPLEPHNRPLIPESWWKMHMLAATDEHMGTPLAQFAEELADCEHHPGMIVRHVAAAFETVDQACVRQALAKAARWAGSCAP